MEKHMTKDARENTITKQTRIGWIDALKGLGIILVVLGHIAQGYLASNLIPDSERLLESIHACIYSFHMYLFFILSGITFSIAFYEKGRIERKKIICQIKNIIYVFSLFSIAQWCCKYFFSNFVNNEYGILDLLLFAIKPMSPYWYLWVLAIYYCTFLLLDRKEITCTVLLTIALVISLASSFIDTGFNETPKNVFFFVFPFTLGRFAFRECEGFYKRKYLAMPICVLSIIILAMLIVRPIEIENIPVLSVISGTIISIALIGCFRKNEFLGNNRFFKYVGRYSLEIYVMHCFITAPMRKILIMVGIQNAFLHLILSLVLAIAIPIIVAVLLKKINIYRFIFKPFTLSK